MGTMTSLLAAEICPQLRHGNRVSMASGAPCREHFFSGWLHSFVLANVPLSPSLVKPGSKHSLLYLEDSVLNRCTTSLCFQSMVIPHVLSGGNPRTVGVGRLDPTWRDLPGQLSRKKHLGSLTFQRRESLTHVAAGSLSLNV